MRNEFAKILDAAEGHELLTTGEAAKLMGVSRQHIVDLCDRGDLPFVTVGTHRRIRGSDLRLAQSRTERLSRDQLRSLWLSHSVAGKLVENPERMVAEALEYLNRFHHTRRTNVWNSEWRQLLDGPIEPMLTALTSTSPRNRELRQNSPFATALSEDERRTVLDAFARAHPGGRA